MGLFSGISNLADLPMSMVRDVVGGVRRGEWENPFDQLLDPFGEEDRLTTEEATGASGVPALLLELGMDPLTYLGGAGLYKALLGPSKFMKARRAAKATQVIKRNRALRQSRGRAGGLQTAINKRKRAVASQMGHPGLDLDLITEELAQGVNRTLKGPPGPGILSRMRGGIAARGRGLKGRARHGFRQFRRLPITTQAIAAGKLSPGWASDALSFGEEGGGPAEGTGDEVVDAILQQYPSLEGFFEEQAMGTNEPLNMASPMEILLMNTPEPSYSQTRSLRRMATPDYDYPSISPPMDLGY